MFIPFRMRAFSDFFFSPPIKYPGTTHVKGYIEKMSISIRIRRDNGA